MHFRDALILFVLAVQILVADGGTILFRRASGNLDVTVLSKADKLRVGDNDISVLVQRRDKSTVLDASVLVHLTKRIDGDVTRITGIANHAKAANKLLYATTIKVPSEGRWELTTDVNAHGESISINGPIQVEPPSPPIASYWPYVAMVPLAAVAFFLNRWLRQRFRAKR